MMGDTQMKVNTFDEALEMVDSMTIEEREQFLEILQKRLIDEKREELVKTIREAKQEYRKGKIKTGTVDALMREIAE